MVHLEGDNDLQAAPDVVWAKLSDARFLVQCIPGVETVLQAEPALARCLVRPGFAFVRGTLEITLHVPEAEPGTTLRYLVNSKGIGSSSTVTATVDVTVPVAGTRVRWVANVTELGGLLRAVPQGLIKASAQKVIADLWTNLEGRLGG